MLGSLKSIPGVRPMNVARVQFLIRLRNQLRHPKAVEARNVRCPLCGEESRFNVAYRPYIFSRLRIVRCGGCDLRFLRPMPTQAYYNAYYAPGTFGSALGRRDSEATSPAAKRVHQELNKKSDRIFEFILPLLKGRQELTALEVGAGNGSNLVVLKALGGRLTLYEDELDRTWSGQLADKGILQWQKRPPDTKADLIILSHVLEHFRDPLSELKGLIRHLADNGMIYIEVPNVPENAAPGLPYKFVHTMYFSEQSLRKTAGEAGLEPAKFHSSSVLATVWRRPTGSSTLLSKRTN